MTSGKRRPRRLRDVDSGERSLRLGLAAADYTIVLFFAHLLFGRPYWMLAVPAVVPAGIILAAQLGVLHLIHRGTHAALAPDGYGYQRQFSEHDALVAAGRIGEATDFYRAHLVAWPDDLEARCRLGELLAAHGDPAEAERVLREARSRDRGGQFGRRIDNDLNDISRRLGDPGRLGSERRRAARGALPD